MDGLRPNHLRNERCSLLCRLLYGIKALEEVGSWFIEKVVLVVFLRSRRLKDRQIAAILNGRYAYHRRDVGIFVRVASIAPQRKHKLLLLKSSLRYEGLSATPRAGTTRTKRSSSCVRH